MSAAALVLGLGIAPHNVFGLPGDLDLDSLKQPCGILSAFEVSLADFRGRDVGESAVWVVPDRPMSPAPRRLKRIALSRGRGHHAFAWSLVWNQEKSDGRHLPACCRPFLDLGAVGSDLGGSNALPAAATT